MAVYKTLTVNMHDIKGYSDSATMHHYSKFYSCRKGIPVTSTRQEKKIKCMPHEWDCPACRWDDCLQR